MALSSEATMRVLLERLNWPVRLVRWRAAKEFGALLSSAERLIAVKVYFDWMKSRRLEMEIVSGLCVLLFVEPDQLPPADDVRQSIQRSSILADFLFQRIYRQVLGSWVSANSGSAPPDFVPEDYFDEHKGKVVPLVLFNNLEELEKEHGFPLVRQWAYEWRQVMDQTGSPYSSHPYHFVDVAGSREGIGGQFSLAQCSVYRSAYLRTLSFAVQEWEMPRMLALRLAGNCLPLNRGLESIEPGRRPRWLADVPEQCCKPEFQLEELVRRIVANGISAKGMKPVSMSIPISTGLMEFGELSIEACFVSGDFSPKESDDEFGRLMVWQLPDRLSYEGELPERDPEQFRSDGAAGSMVPVCLSIWPVPLGFWLNEYAHLGIVLPAPYNFPSGVEVNCSGGTIGLFAEGALVGRWKIWHDDWSPLQPTGGHTRCGRLTEMQASALDAACTSLGMNLGWHVELKMWERPKEYGELKLMRRTAFFRD